MANKKIKDAQHFFRVATELCDELEERDSDLAPKARQVKKYLEDEFQELVEKEA